MTKREKPNNEYASTWQHRARRSSDKHLRLLEKHHPGGSYDAIIGFLGEPIVVAGAGSALVAAVFYSLGVGGQIGN